MSEEVLLHAMSGRGKKVDERPRAKAPGSGRRKSSAKAEEQKRASADVEAPTEVKKKPEQQKKGEEKKHADNKARGGAQPRDTRPPASSEPLCASNDQPCIAKSAEVKKVPRGPPKKGNSMDGNPARILQDTLEKLKIRKNQKNEVAKYVNDIHGAINKHVEVSLSWCKRIQVLKTGSYYENVKICECDEFDLMLAVSVERVDIQPFGEDGAFYSVAVKRHSKHPLDRFLNEDKTIKASEMLKEFRDKVKEAAAKLPYDVTVDRKKQGCPAVTLQVKKGDTLISLDFVLGLEVHSSSWPHFTNDGFKIDNWLGKKVKRDLKYKPYYLVSKYQGRGTREQDGVIAKDAWRISFSHVEKEILKNHGHSKTCCESQPCCRKQCLKLLKYLVQRLKEMYPKEAAKLCSYHAKTTLLHACANRVEDSEWAADQLSHCFQLLLHDFEEHLRKQHLPNFFVPSHNLLKSAGMDKKSCNLLADYIEYERNNGFPLFR
ncbi:cyclic GMP-AMP synthase [Pygocentrus nattereri]|uniref:Cyclic GMP-AMP synthase n=1 Tax=Pygocentrus nattereri TaxID=42514 RepID=A0A3B4DMU4_PYGNA|nr:cyclic GMP-AMP synthase [Pygocentrus nattereri]